MNQTLPSVHSNLTQMDHNLSEAEWNSTAMHFRNQVSKDFWVLMAFYNIERVYYPFLAVIGVIVNVLTIVILYREKCGLSKDSTTYLMAITGADLLIIFIDLILRQIPTRYEQQFIFMTSIPLCNVHAVVLYTAIDCSVWFTVAFIFDQFVSIVWQKLKAKYCTDKTVVVVLGTMTMFFCLKNLMWFFMLTNQYQFRNVPLFCAVREAATDSLTWAIIEMLHHIFTPGIPFVLILLLNILTVRHNLLTNKERVCPEGHSIEETPSDTEMVNQRKYTTLLFALSVNFMSLWVMLFLYSLWNRMFWLGYKPIYLPRFFREIGQMLQFLSYCTNICIYILILDEFKEDLKYVVKYPFVRVVAFVSEKKN